MAARRSIVLRRLGSRIEEEEEEVRLILLICWVSRRCVARLCLGLCVRCQYRW